MLQQLLTGAQWASEIFSAHNVDVPNNGILGKMFEEEETVSVCVYNRIL